MTAILSRGQAIFAAGEGWVYRGLLGGGGGKGYKIEYLMSDRTRSPTYKKWHDPNTSTGDSRNFFASKIEAVSEGQGQNDSGVLSLQGRIAEEAFLFTGGRIGYYSGYPHPTPPLIPTSHNPPT
jgi:hypothetical protein